MEVEMAKRVVKARKTKAGRLVLTYAQGQKRRAAWEKALNKVQDLHNKGYKDGLLSKHICLTAGSKTVK